MSKLGGILQSAVKWASSDFIGRVLFLVAGGLLWHTLSDFYNGLLGRNETILIAATVLLAMLASGTIMVTGNMAVSSVQKLTKTAAVSIRHVEEQLPRRSSLHGRYQGKVFTALEEYIRNAERRIVVVTSPVYEGKNADYQQARKHYLKVIEETLAKRRGSRFRYLRILQIPRQDADKPLEEVLADETVEHCKNVLSAAAGGRASIQWLKIERLSPYILIDDTYVVIEQDGVDEGEDGGEGGNNLYIEGFFFVEDRGGTILSAYEDSFEELYGRSREVVLDAQGRLVRGV